jgi:hypothetical protein
MMPQRAIRALSDAAAQHVSWHAKIFDRARKRERIRRNDADVALEVDERALVERLRIDIVELMFVKILNSVEQRMS